MCWLLLGAPECQGKSRSLEAAIVASYSCWKPMFLVGRLIGVYSQLTSMQNLGPSRCACQHSHAMCSSVLLLPSRASEFAQTGTCPNSRKHGCPEVLFVTLIMPQQQHVPLSLPELCRFGHSLASPEHVTTFCSSLLLQIVLHPSQTISQPLKSIFHCTLGS